MGGFIDNDQPNWAPLTNWLDPFPGDGCFSFYSPVWWFNYIYIWYIWYIWYIYMIYIYMIYMIYIVFTYDIYGCDLYIYGILFIYIYIYPHHIYILYMIYIIYIYDIYMFWILWLWCLWCRFARGHQMMRFFSDHGHRLESLFGPNPLVHQVVLLKLLFFSGIQKLVRRPSHF